MYNIEIKVYQNKLIVKKKIKKQEILFQTELFASYIEINILMIYLFYQHFLHASYPADSAADLVTCRAFAGFIFPQSGIL